NGATDQRKRVTVTGDGVAIADSQRLTHILQNLVRHATDGDATNVSGRISQEPRTVVVEVADDVFPLDEYVSRRIFGSSYVLIRPDPHKSTLALGLSVAHRLAKVLGGDLTYRHADGENILELKLPGAPGPTPHHEDKVVDPLAGRPSR